MSNDQGDISQTTPRVGKDDPIYRIRQREWMADIGWAQGRFRHIDEWMTRLGLHSRHPQFLSSPLSDDAQRKINARLASVPRIKL